MIHEEVAQAQICNKCPCGSAKEQPNLCLEMIG